MLHSNRFFLFDEIIFSELAMSRRGYESYLDEISEQYTCNMDTFETARALSSAGIVDRWQIENYITSMRNSSLIMKSDFINIEVLKTMTKWLGQKMDFSLFDNPKVIYGLTGHFTNLEKVRVLDLSRNKIESLHGLQRVRCQNIEKLILSNNKLISIRELAKCANWRNLKNIDISLNFIKNPQTLSQIAGALHEVNTVCKENQACFQSDYKQWIAKLNGSSLKQLNAKIYCGDQFKAIKMSEKLVEAIKRRIPGLAILQVD